MIKRQPSPDIRAVNTTLKSYRDSIGKPTQRHHYINEAKLIRFAMSGRNQRICDIKAPTRMQRKLYERVLNLSCSLIKEGIDFKLRKQVCRQLVENHKATKST